jgi:hypothetical protein
MTTRTNTNRHGKTRTVIDGVKVGFAAAGIIGAMTAAVLAAEPVAHANTNGAFSGPEGDADGYAYLIDISPYLTGGSPADAAALGRQVCGQLADGVSEGRLIYAGSSNGKVSISDSRYIVHGAEWHFCPTYY